MPGLEYVIGALFIAGSIGTPLQTSRDLAVPPGIYELRASSAQEQCLAVGKSAPDKGVEVVLSSCGGAAQHRWAISKSPSKVGFVLIDHAGDYRWFWTPRERPDGLGVVVDLKVMGASQLWELIPAGAGRVRIRSSSQQCLAAKRTTIALESCDVAVPPNQVWVSRFVANLGR